MARILVFNDPNPNPLDIREPQAYGPTPLNDTRQRLRTRTLEYGHHVTWLSPHAEHELMHAARSEETDAMPVNSAAFTHDSVALCDALAGAAIFPFVVLHLSNVHVRKPFRTHLYEVVRGAACGFGTKSHEPALDPALHRPGSLNR